MRCSTLGRLPDCDEPAETPPTYVAPDVAPNCGLAGGYATSFWSSEPFCCAATSSAWTCARVTGPLACCANATAGTIRADATTTAERSDFMMTSENIC